MIPAKKSKLIIPPKEELDKDGITAELWKIAEAKKYKATNARDDRTELKKLRIELPLLNEKIKMLETSIILSSKKRKSQENNEIIEKVFEIMSKNAIEKLKSEFEIIKSTILSVDDIDNVTQHESLQSYILPDIVIKIEAKDE
jgi:hypothetical protein